ncbi:Ig domain-containing protein [Paludisphaera mucosa]|uniref:Ig domain-containing protein n=1 Tax=Paludisphaera mucosa TaxID=3030827 RepID=A0ABT6FBI5_9BACT|nr:Ig domain-containing protein [Paludisphaera mucosa]MDG3004804.1 Ig domain-containing protein [Paludisphaera mucosa]
MRRNRRGGGHQEFGGSGEDSFVAVVVTKLTGALLFILLLTMVIMALLPKAVDLAAPGASKAAAEARPLRIVTPPDLPEAIAGRPYAVAAAADGGRGPLRWSLDGALPPGLTFDAATGLLKGTPAKGTPQPLHLALRVTDGEALAAGPLRLVVYQSDVPLSTPVWWKPGIPPVPWRAWLDNGVGFLILWLVHLVGMSALAGFERQAAAMDLAIEGDAGAVVAGAGPELAPRRFVLYRAMVRLSTLSAMIGLAAWLWSTRP